MRYIEWILDTEDGLDAYDPLGKIVILGDEGNIEEKSTYLDAFFEALAEGTKCIKPGKIVTIDSWVEPDDIIFDRTSDRLVISYGNWRANILDRVRFLNDLRQAIQELVEQIDELASQEGQEKRKLTKLRNFLDETLD
ncbi:MAG: hypothetical protein J7641_00680 [Cyanobacteria bacterium SID2]|nr:hypothetical protein [Cyanobacteria bacterium SID2]